MITFRALQDAISGLEAKGKKPDFGKVIDDLSIILEELNLLEVHGEESLDTLLGCIIFIKKLIGGDGEDG